MLEVAFHGAMVMFSIGIIFALFVGPWQSLVIDVVRQRAFEIRDRALLWSYDNDRLEDKAYLEFREAVNHTIRYFEEMSFMKILVLALLHKRYKQASQGRERFGFMDDAHFHKEFNVLTGTLVLGLILRSSVGLSLCMLLLPVAMFAFIMNGKVKNRSKGIASIVRREVQTDLLLAI